MTNKPPGLSILGRPLSDLSPEETKLLAENMEALMTAEGVFFGDIVAGTASCDFCDTTVFSDKQLYHHILQRHPSVVAAIQQDIEKGKPSMNAAIRKHASNRQVISQLEAWGWTKGKTRQQEVQMTLDRDGLKEVWIRREHIEKTNPYAIWPYIYEATGVSPEEFWGHKGPARVVDLTLKTEAPTDDSLEQKQAAQRARHISTRVLELLIAQEKPLTTHYISQTLGFTEAETSRACSYLVSKGLATNVKRRMWQAIQTHHHQSTSAVDVTVTTDQQAGSEPAPVVVPGPEPAAIAPPVRIEKVSSVPTDEEVLALLDMISPNGFKAKDFPRVMEWVQSTQNLIAGLD